MAHAKPEASEEGLTATSALLSAGRQRSAKKPAEVLAWRSLLTPPWLGCMDYRSIDVSRLCACAVGVEPQQYDFGQGFDSEWDIPFERTEADRANGEYEPMMNYRYELPEFTMPDDVKRWLDDAGAVTVVYFPKEDRYYLALTGGGMDLSWDICRAYVLLGYLPPLHFCDLPKFAGMNLRSVRNAKVLQSCTRSAQVSVNGALNVQRTLQALARS